MRRAVVLLITLAALGIGVSQTTQGQDPDMAALPKAVRAALDRVVQVYPQPLNGAHWSAVNTLTGTDHPIFQIQGTNARGNKIELEVTEAGRVIEVEEHGIPSSEVPAAVSDALKAKMPSFQPTLIEAIYQAEKPQPVSYGFEGKDAAGKKIEVYISADGRTFLN